MPPNCGAPVAFVAEVAGGGDDDDAGVDGALGGQRQRVGRERLEHAGGDRQVDDADVVGVLDRDRVVDRGDDVADVAVSVRVEHLERRPGCAPGRHARARAVRVEAVAGNDPGHVRAVPEVVGRAAPTARLPGVSSRVKSLKCTTRGDAVGFSGFGQVEIVVPGGDAGVDDGDADALARQTELPPRTARRRWPRRCARSSRTHRGRAARARRPAGSRGSSSAWLSTSATCARMRGQPSAARCRRCRVMTRRVRRAAELHDDPRAAGQLPGPGLKNRIEISCALRLRRHERGKDHRGGECDQERRDVRRE